jgi:peptide subunit release factor RF-3
MTLALDVTKDVWPIGQGRDFSGAYDILDPALRLLLDGGDNHIRLGNLDDPNLQ